MLSERDVFAFALTQARQRVDVLDRYKLRRDRRMVWLQRLCFWVLSKLGAYGWEEQITTHAVHLSRASLIDFIQEHRCNVERLFECRGGRLIIGRKQAHQLLGEMASRYPYSYPMDVDFCRGDDWRVLGLKVTVLPWLDCAFILPDNVL